SLRAWLARLPWPMLGAGWALAYLVGLAVAAVLHLAGWWERGGEWERAVLIAVHDHVSPALDVVMLWRPLVGTNYGLAPIVVIAAVWLWKRGRHTAALHLAVVQAGS